MDWNNFYFTNYNVVWGGPAAICITAIRPVSYQLNKLFIENVNPMKGYKDIQERVLDTLIDLAWSVVVIFTIIQVMTTTILNMRQQQLDFCYRCN